MEESPLAPRRALLLLSGITALIFARALLGSFHADDYLLLQDPAITSPAGFGGFWHLTTTRPLAWLSYWLSYQTGGINPAPWLVFGLVLHLACVALLYDSLRRLLTPLQALAAAALFALHPLQTEAVAWVFARATLLAALFCLLSLRSWILEQRPAAVLWFALALLSKEECVFFPVLLFLLRGPARELAAMLGLSLLAGLRVILATRLLPGSGAGFSSANSPAQYLLAQGSVIWRYFRLLAVPAGQNFTPDIHIAPWLAALGWAALLALALVCWKIRARWLLGGLAILMASSSVFAADDLSAERRLYLPMIAFAPAIILALPAKRAALATWLALLAVLSFLRLGVWADERSFWTDAVAKSPALVRPRIQLARALPPEEALRHLQTAAATDPASPLPFAEMGRIHLQQSRADLAISDFGRATALNPRDPQLWNNLGGAFAMLSQKAAADRAFQRALALEPCHADARRNLGLPPC